MEFCCGYKGQQYLYIKQKRFLRQRLMKTNDFIGIIADYRWEGFLVLTYLLVHS